MTTSRLHVVNSLAIPVVLATLGVVFTVQQITRDPTVIEVSTAENRALAPLPSFSWRALKTGETTKGLDLYVADHFPFRDAFFAVADVVRGAKGVDTATAFYEAKDKDEGGLEDVAEWAGAADAGVVVDAGAAADDDVDAGFVVDAGPKKKKKKLKDGVIVADGRALMLFTGDDDDARKFADVVNVWRAALPDTVNVHLVVTPTALPFYVPASELERTNDEVEALVALKAAVDPKVKFADVYGELSLHVDEPIFFKTDHHWTGLGAYYGYKAFCAAAGLNPVGLDTLTHVDGREAPGSLYRMTKDPRLLKIKDPVELWLPSVTYTALKTETAEEKKATKKASFVDVKEKGYLAFLGGDNPLMIANVDTADDSPGASSRRGKVALVVKNSYGNAFAPWLLPHFEKVVVVDYRYYAFSVQKLVEEQGVTDVVVVNATTTAISRPHQRRLQQSLKGTGVTWEPITAECLAREEAEKKAKEEARASLDAGLGVVDAGVGAAP